MGGKKEGENVKSVKSQGKLGASVIGGAADSRGVANVGLIQ